MYHNREIKNELRTFSMNKFLNFEASDENLNWSWCFSKLEVNFCVRWKNPKYLQEIEIWYFDFIY